MFACRLQHAWGLRLWRIEWCDRHLCHVTGSDDTNYCVFTCIILIIVFHCTHVRMSYVLNFYLLTYLLNARNGRP